MPVKTVFVDSSDTVGLLMNASPNSQVNLGQNIVWLGRSGIIEIDKINIGFISGIDSDILGTEVY